MAANPIETDMFSMIHNDSEVQTTVSVKDPKTSFVAKLLHPPSPIPGFMGLPTNDARTQVLIEWRNMELMDTPVILDFKTLAARTVTPADLTTFDYAILSTNGARVLNIGFVTNATAGGTMQQDLNGVMTQNLYNWKNWSSDANLYRPTYRSLTTTLNATAFNNTGMVVGNQFNPNILFAGSLISFAHEHGEHFYNFVRCAIEREEIFRLNKPTREDIERWEQFPHYHRVEMLRLANSTPGDTLNLDPNTTIQVINFGNVSANQPAGSQPTPDRKSVV